MKTIFPIFILVCLFASCTNTVEPADSPQEPEPISESEQAINQLVLDAYAAISFDEGTTPNYDALRAVFTEDAIFQNFRGDTLSTANFEEFLAEYRATVESGQLISFNEVELGGVTEYFGKIGHRISAYASYINSADEIGERGVNSFQVIYIDGEWKVNSIVWDIEREGLPIPSEYAPE
jgi:hypothetical protein